MRCIALLLVVFLPCAALAEEPPRQIVVVATGTATATPDMATITIGVSREALTASEAMDMAADAATKVVDRIFEAGIEARDVQTTAINLNPVWEHGNTRPPEVRGYAASSMLSIRVRDLDLLGGLLDSVVGDGANALSGLTFGIAEPEPLEAEARAEAVREARRKAETLAEAAGVVLGPVQTISEGGGYGAPAPVVRGAMMEAAAMPVAAGELDIRVDVTVIYGIVD